MHTHITNTRIGDVEILERRYPVLVHEFSIREGSGGRGKFNGGNGVIRDIEFLEEIRVSILSEVSSNANSSLPFQQIGTSSAVHMRRTDWKAVNPESAVVIYGSSNPERRTAICPMLPTSFCLQIRLSIATSPVNKIRRCPGSSMLEVKQQS